MATYDDAAGFAKLYKMSPDEFAIRTVRAVFHQDPQRYVVDTEGVAPNQAADLLQNAENIRKSDEERARRVRPFVDGKESFEDVIGDISSVTLTNLLRRGFLDVDAITAACQAPGFAD
jgi:hypothetical protein